MSDPERIWLQNADDARATGDRLWCQDKVWPECDEQQEPTEYIRADLYASLRREVEEAKALAFAEVEQKAREWAEHYPHASDGRNTFILFAEWADRQAAIPKVEEKRT